MRQADLGNGRNHTLSKLGDVLAKLYDLSREEQEIVLEELSGILAPEDSPMLPSQVIDLKRRISEYESGQANLIDGDTVLRALRESHASK